MIKTADSCPHSVLSMNYCLNPSCPQPDDPGHTQFCQNCGAKLWLRDRYRAIRLLGRGGFSRTFLGVDQFQPQPLNCVIKQFYLPPEYAADPENARRANNLFEREGLSLRELGQHSQIPELLDEFAEDDQQYLVLEYIDGNNLEEELWAKGVFNEAKIRHVLSDLLSILEFMHDRQLIHRDIKPDNIIHRSSDDQMVLVDFGATKLITATAFLKRGTHIGTEDYTAPEQQLHGRATYASDIYSLGVTCIHLLTQMPPRNLLDTATDEWIWERYTHPPISPGLAQILNKMLALIPALRYATAGEVLADLQNLGEIVEGSDTIEPEEITESDPEMLAPLDQSTGLSPLSQKSPDLPLVWTSPSGGVSSATTQFLSWRCVQTLTASSQHKQSGGINTLVLSPAGQIMLSGNANGSIGIWHLQTGILLSALTGHEAAVSAIGISRDGKFLASGSEDATIKIWNLASQRLLHTLKGHTAAVTAVAFSAGAGILVSSGEDESLKFWSLNSRTALYSLSAHAGGVNAVTFNPDGAWFASTGNDKLVKLWELATGRLLHTLPGHVDRVLPIAFSPDGLNLASGSADQTIRLWSLRAGAQISDTQPINLLQGHTASVLALAFSPDAKLLASGGGDRTINLWTWKTRELSQKLKGHEGCVRAVAFSADSQLLVSGSEDGTIKLWRRPQQSVRKS